MKTLTIKPSKLTYKKTIFLFMGFLYVLPGFCQETKYFFTGFYNYQEGENRSPMIGLVNQSHDGVEGAQIGLFNTNKAELYGSSIGLINQLGLVQSGASIGLINNAENHLKDLSIGLVNRSKESSEGFHLGLVNLTNNSSKGLRVGLVNQSYRHQGLMIGLVNKADSLDGKAIGLINLLKQDVFLAVALNYHYDKWAEFQLKSGIEELYGIVSYQKGLCHFWESHAIGYGLGTRIPLGKKFLISPELLYHGQVSPYRDAKEKRNHKFSANVNLILPLSKRVELVYGKSLHYAKNNPFFHESVDRQSWANKPTQVWLSGNIGAIIRLK